MKLLRVSGRPWSLEKWKVSGAEDHEITGVSGRPWSLAKLKIIKLLGVSRRPRSFEKRKLS